MKKKSPLEYSHFLLVSMTFIFICIVIFFIFINSIHYIEVNGIIKPLNYQTITPIHSGIIKNVYFKDGDTVNIGDLVLEMDDSEYKIQIENYTIEKEKIILYNKKLSTEIELLGDKNVIDKKIRDRKKNGVIIRYNAGDISEVEYNNAINNMELEELEEIIKKVNIENEIEQNIKRIESVDINIKLLQNNIDKSKIYSRLNGIIIDSSDSIKLGGYYEYKDIIQTIYSNNAIYAEAYIPEKHIPKVELNQKAKIFITSLPYTKYKVFSGELKELEKSSDKSVYVGKIEIFDPFFKIKSINELKTKELMFGMSLKARINVGKENLIKIFLGLE